MRARGRVFFGAGAAYLSTSSPKSVGGVEVVGVGLSAARARRGAGGGVAAGGNEAGGGAGEGAGGTAGAAASTARSRGATGSAGAAGRSGGVGAAPSLIRAPRPYGDPPRAARRATLRSLRC